MTRHRPTHPGSVLLNVLLLWALSLCTACAAGHQHTAMQGQASPGSGQIVAQTGQDTDQDGVSNNDDACPNSPEDVDGWEDDDGCPDPDNDQDGVADVDDMCPMVPEILNGYEDQDGCPDDPPFIAKPVPHPPQVDRIHFAEGSTTVSAQQGAVLDAAAEIMHQHPEILTLQLAGHADDPGNEAANLKLSQRRAEAVRDALIQRGVAPSRLVAKGYGRQVPLHPRGGDKAAQQRAGELNRRVEFAIVEKQ